MKKTGYRVVALLLAGALVVNPVWASFLLDFSRPHPPEACTIFLPEALGFAANFTRPRLSHGAIDQSRLIHQEHTLYMEANSWVGLLYQDFVRRDENILEATNSSKFLERMELLRMKLEEMRAKLQEDIPSLEWHQFLETPAKTVAGWLAELVAPFAETERFLSDVDFLVEVSRFNGILHRLTVERIIEDAIELAILRHPMILLKGASSPLNRVDSQHYHHPMRQTMRSWIPPALSTYIEEYLSNRIPESQRAGVLSPIFEAIFSAHRRANQEAKLGILYVENSKEENWDYVSYVYDETMGVGRIEDYGHELEPGEIEVTFAGPKIRRVLKRNVQPMYNLTFMRMLCGLESDDIVVTALDSGRLKPDHMFGKDVPLFFPENWMEFLDGIFGPLVDDDAFDAFVLGKILGKRPNRVFDLMRAGRLVPSQVITKSDGSIVHLFPRQKVESYKELYAPELVADSYSTAGLAKLLGQTERRVLLAIEDGSIDPVRIGPRGYPHYLATHEDIQRWKDMFASLQEPQATRILSGDPNDVISERALAQALGEPLKNIRAMVVRREIDPSQKVRSPDGFIDYYFPAEKLPLYIRVFAPDKLPNVYQPEYLARVLDRAKDPLLVAMHDGLVEPDETLGTALKPFWVVKTATMRRILDTLDPPGETISIYEFADKYSANSLTVKDTAVQYGIPLKVQNFGGRIHRGVPLKEEARLAALLPRRAPQGKVSREVVVQRTGISRAVLERLPAHEETRLGSQTNYWYWEHSLPAKGNARSTRAWLRKLESRVPSVVNTTKVTPSMSLPKVEQTDFVLELKRVEFGDTMLAAHAKKGESFSPRVVWSIREGGNSTTYGMRDRIRKAIQNARTANALRTAHINKPRIRKLQKHIDDAIRAGWNYATLETYSGVWRGTIKGIHESGKGIIIDGEERLLRAIPPMLEAARPLGKPFGFNVSDIIRLMQRWIQLRPDEVQFVPRQFFTALKQLVKDAHNRGITNGEISQYSHMDPDTFRGMQDVKDVSFGAGFERLNGLLRLFLLQKDPSRYRTRQFILPVECRQKLQASA